MSSTVPAAPDRSAATLHVAWMSILLGLTIEGLLLASSALSGKSLEAKPILADSVQKISWSAIVCMGLALGVGVSKMRPAAMGIAGLIAAPIAFSVSRALHKGAVQALGVEAAVAAGPSPLTLALIKAVEYGCLGIALDRVGRRFTGAIPHAVTGLVIGLIFGGTVVGLVVAGAAQPLTAGAFASRAINEVIFPVGCSLVLYSAQYLARGIGKGV